MMGEKTAVEHSKLWDYIQSAIEKNAKSNIFWKYLESQCIQFHPIYFMNGLDIILILISQKR